jgi:hypothetical protein
MTIKELKERLSEFDENLEVKMKMRGPFVCSCREDYCYCEAPELDGVVNSIHKEEAFDFKSRQQELVAIVLTI